MKMHVGTRLVVYADMRRFLENSTAYAFPYGCERYVGAKREGEKRSTKIPLLKIYVDATIFQPSLTFARCLPDTNILCFGCDSTKAFVLTCNE